MITDLDKVIDLLKSEGPRFDEARAALGRVRAVAVQYDYPDALAAVPLADGTATVGIAPEGTDLDCEMCDGTGYTGHPEGWARCACVPRGQRKLRGFAVRVLGKELADEFATADAAPVSRTEYEQDAKQLAERIEALESRAAKHEAVTRALGSFTYEALEALVDNRKANVKVGLEFRKAIRAAGWDK